MSYLSALTHFLPAAGITAAANLVGGGICQFVVEKVAEAPDTKWLAWGAGAASANAFLINSMDSSPLGSTTKMVAIATSALTGAIYGQQGVAQNTKQMQPDFIHSRGFKIISKANALAGGALGAYVGKLVFEHTIPSYAPFVAYMVGFGIAALSTYKAIVIATGMQR